MGGDGGCFKLKNVLVTGGRCTSQQDLSAFKIHFV